MFRHVSKPADPNLEGTFRSPINFWAGNKSVNDTVLLYLDLRVAISSIILKSHHMSSIWSFMSAKISSHLGKNAEVPQIWTICHQISLKNMLFFFRIHNQIFFKRSMSTVHIFSSLVTKSILHREA